MAISERSSSKNKIWLVVVGIVVLAGAAYVATIYPPPEKSLAGSVSPAERYRVDPTGSNTTPLGDQSVSQFMQTDLYQKVVTDKALGEALFSEAFRDALSNELFRNALANESFRNALANESFRDSLKNDAMQAVKH